MRGACALGARRVVRIAIQVQPARIGAPLGFELLPGQGFGFGRAGGLLRGRELRGGGFPVDHDQILGAHSRSRVERRDHTVMSSLVMPAISAIPEQGSTGAHSKPRSTWSSCRRVA